MKYFRRWLRETELRLDDRGRYCVRRGWRIAHFESGGLALLWFVLLRQPR